MYGLCRCNVKDCQVNQRRVDRTDAVAFDAGLCIWNEVRSWPLKEPPYSAYHATRGNFFKGLGLWRFVKAYDRKACTNKAMWEEKENGSDNALCHSYYTSQLLSPMRAPQLTGISRQGWNAGPVTQPVCSGVGGDLWENFCSRIKLFPVSLLLVPVMWRNHTAGKYDQGNKMEKSYWTTEQRRC